MATILVEVFFATLRTDNGAVIASRSAAAASRNNPSDLARMILLANFPNEVDRADTVLHSTSWHFSEADLAVYLSFLVYGHDLPVATSKEARTLSFEWIAARPSREADAPDHKTIDDFRPVAHGMRHLAYLVQIDPTVRGVLARRPDKLAVIESFTPALFKDVTPQ